MRLPTDRRVYVLLVGVAALASIGIWWLVGPRRLSPEDAAARMHGAGSRLASASGDVSVSVDVVLPEQLGGTQRFEGNGTVEFDEEIAAITYDFSELVNAAGGFGALQEFHVVLDGGTVYVEVFQEGPAWISFPPEESARRDVERLRELVLASPLVLPDLLKGAESASGIVSGSEVQLRGGAGSALLLRSTNEASNAMFPLLDDLAISEIPVEVRLIESEVNIDYEVAFPVSPDSVDRIVVRISTQFRPGDAPMIDVPAESETRDFEELFE